MSCHKNIYDEHIQTGHYLTSQPSSEKNILGSFKSGKNSFKFNASGKVNMERREDGYYQVEYVMDKEERKARFDITTGSGKKGQSYLSWKNNSLIQMPVTYFTPTQAWTSSPGFDPRKIRFDRVVTSRCLECHSTYVQTVSPPGQHPEAYNQQNIVFGVDCEKCHGPAKEHVNFHTKNPGKSEAKFIVNPAKMSRQINIDLCGLCHAGSLTKTKPSFSFQVGDTLMNFFYRSNIRVAINGLDVHGNQLGLLSESKCFTASNMTCQSCHSPHKKEQEVLEVFSQRCSNCHGEGKNPLCRLMKTEGHIINKNCIDCHMPKLPSKTVIVFEEGATSPTSANLRTHYIGIYKEESDKVLDTLKKRNRK